MPLFILFSLSVLAFAPFHSASAACDRPVDPSRAAIFIDTNFGLTEMRKAEKAACDRGETFIRFPAEVPGEEEAHAALVRQTNAKKALDRAKEDLTKMKCAIPIAAAENADLIAPDASPTADSETASLSADSSCSSLQQKYLEASTRYETHTSSVDAFIKTIKDANGGDNFFWGMVKRGFIALAKQGIRPTTLIISGHSSGSSFGGRYGGIMFASLQQHLTTAYAENPELLSGFRSIFLWGCNTLNPYEPEKWVKVFPTLEMIVGFQGSAPSNLNSSSWTILESLMRQEETLVKGLPNVRDPDEIRVKLSGIPGISGSVAAVYFHDIANERGWFYERVQERDETTGRTAWVSRASELMSAKECEPIRAQVTRDQSYIETILSGSTAISNETGSGALREAYTRSRRNDICRAALGFKHSADRIGLLLFWHDVKKNAMRMLESDTRTLEAELDKWEGNKSQLAAMIAASNADVRSGKATRNGDLEKSRKNALEKIETFQARLSAIAAGEALLPWTKERKQEMKALSRRVRKLTKAFARGKVMADALETARSDLSHYREAEKIYMASRIGDGQKAVMGPMKSSYAHVQASLNFWEKHLTNVNVLLRRAGGTFAILDAKAVSQQISAVAKTLSPKSVSDISGLSYAEVLEKNRVRVAALRDLERSITASPVLMTSLSTLLSAAKTWDSRFQKTVIQAETRCMNFLDWHEYLPNQSEAARPRLSCNDG